MFVPKKNKTSQMVIDYRKLNNITEDDANKTLYQEQKQDLLQRAKIITIFDIK